MKRFAPILLAAIVPTALVANAATLSFSGETWTIKSSRGRVGPGPNYFASGTQNVWVDAQGRLHLRITNRKGRWYCAEVVSTRSFGHGTYRFYLDTPVDALDPNVVLGLFTWSDLPAYHNREIDIEFSRWGQAANLNAQYVVQPYTTTGNMLRWPLPPGLARTHHAFTWTPSSIAFASANASDNSPLQTWTYGGPDIPVPGGENARINLWLFQGAAPQNRQEVEVIIQRFEFIPSP